MLKGKGCTSSPWWDTVKLGRGLALALSGHFKDNLSWGRQCNNCCLRKRGWTECSQSLDVQGLAIDTVISVGGMKAGWRFHLCDCPNFHCSFSMARKAFS